jgi:esterase/lipase
MNSISDNWKSINKEEFEQIEEHYNAIQQLYQNALNQFSQFVFDLNS